MRCRLASSAPKSAAKGSLRMQLDSPGNELEDLAGDGLAMSLVSSSWGLGLSDWIAFHGRIDIMGHIYLEPFMIELTFSSRDASRSS